MFRYPTKLRPCKSCLLWAGETVTDRRKGDTKGWCRLHRLATWSSGRCSDHQRTFSPIDPDSLPPPPNPTDVYGER